MSAKARPTYSAIAKAAGVSEATVSRVLNGDERVNPERTAELFLSLKGKHSLMVVEHDMGFIRTLGGTVTVLCDGSVLAQGTLDQVQADERVIEVYLGR